MSAADISATDAASINGRPGNDPIAMATKVFGWGMLSVLAAFLINNYLTFWQDMPGSALLHSDGSDTLSWVQLAIYPVIFAVAAFFVFSRSSRGLRQDSRVMTAINTYLIRAVFWAVLLVGLADLIISFMRIENMLEGIFGEDLASDLGRSTFRGGYVHMPIIALSFVIAAVTRGLGFIWLALFVVLAELGIVIGRFVFSYEQAFMADLVRFWYGALFLFASAYTLLEEGHVRVDVFYAGFSKTVKGYVNAIGSLALGILMCWVILVIGMGSKQAAINSPMLSYEVTQAGFGLYVKYLMASFLGVFAVTMLIQFTAYVLDAIADIRDEPGGRDHDVHAVQ